MKRVLVLALVVSAVVLVACSPPEDRAAHQAALEKSLAQGEAQEEATKQQEAHIVAYSKTHLKKSWYKGFGSVLMVSGTIRNDNDMAVRDVEIECNDHAPSGTVIDQNTQTIFDIVKPHSVLKFQNVNFGFIQPQVSTVGCHIKDIGALDPKP